MSGTTLILLLTLLMSLAGLASPRFIDANLLRPWRIAHGAGYHTLVTHALVHADLWHLLFNLLTFWSFGPQLERAIGTPKFLILYISGLLVSGIGTCIQRRNDPHYASLGASGAVLAVLFASIVYFPHGSIFILPIPVPIPAPLFALLYLAYSYMAARSAAAPPEPAPIPGDPASPVPPPLAQPRSRINHGAHILGALTGLAFVLIDDPGAYSAVLRRFSGD